jgi:hypothetical protein
MGTGAVAVTVGTPPKIGRERQILRTTVLWAAGLVAGMIIGGLVGNTFFQVGFSGDAGFFGAIAGAAVFICLRLWATEHDR